MITAYIRIAFIYDSVIIVIKFDFQIVFIGLCRYVFLSKNPDRSRDPLNCYLFFFFHFSSTNAVNPVRKAVSESATHV